MENQIERKCREAGLKLTGQRRTIAKVLTEADDHPSANELFQRCTAVDPKISLSTVLLQKSSMVALVKDGVVGDFSLSVPATELFHALQIS